MEVIFEVWSLGFEVWSLGLGVEFGAFGFEVWSLELGLGVWCVGFRLECLGFRARRSCAGVWFSGFVFRVYGAGFRVQVLGFGVEGQGLRVNRVHQLCRVGRLGFKAWSSGCRAYVHTASRVTTRRSTPISCGTS